MSLRDRLELLRSSEVGTGTLLEHLARIHGDRRLVTEDGDDGLTLTYAEAADRVARWGAAVRERIGPGDRVVVATPNGYELFLLCLAVGRAGGVAVPVNPKMRDDEVAYVIDDSQAALVIRSTTEVEGAEPGEAAPFSPDEVAALFYTSGTTGKPKGAQLTHRALVGQSAKAVLYPSALRRDEVVTGMPVAHIAGFSMLVMQACLGISVYLLRKFRPDTALDAIETRRATMFVGVPAMYRMMLEAGAEQRDLRSVRIWASGADAMPYDLAQRFQRMGAIVTLPLVHSSLGSAAFFDGYGMVELGGGVAVKMSPPGIPLHLHGLLGFPMPGVKMKVVDDLGGELDRGEVGELAVKGPGVMRGYHGSDDATRDAFTHDGWLRTGDLARKRRFGLVEFAGRKKDVIKHGGYSVFAVEVEQVLEQHEAVSEAVVVGLPDERKGEIPAAAVIPCAGMSVTPQELVEWARERLSDYKAPKRVLVVAELPRTGTDKVQKPEVRKMFEQVADLGRVRVGPPGIG
jgi:acyl-CoA synthetase (AMP-forming)/AMP-acid ligase II